jgi:signal transduction histidine kinase
MKSAVGVQANKDWIKDQEPVLNQKGHRTTHTKLNETVLKTILLYNEEQDQQNTKLNMDAKCQCSMLPVKFLMPLALRKITDKEGSILCNTDGSKKEEQVAAGVYITLW